MKKISEFLVTMLGILIISFTASDIMNILGLLKLILQINKPIYIIPLLILFIFPIYISFFLIAKPQYFSKYFYLKEINNSPSFNIKEILAVSIITLGLFTLTHAIVALFGEILRQWFIYFNLSKVEIDADTKSFLASYFVEIIIGLVFSFKGMKIASLFVIEKPSSND